LIIIDNRERSSPIPLLLEKLDVNIRYANLDVGDYIIGDLCIERKDVNDYVQSLLSGHLHQQFYNMSTLYSISYLIIEGFMSQALSERNLKRGIFLSSLAGGTIKRSPDGKSGIINYIMLETSFDTALFLKYLHEKINNLEPRLPTIPRQGISEQDRLIYILSAFPNIGEVKAKKLLNKFKTINRICNATPQELEQELGEKRGLDFYLWLHKVYEENEK